MADHGRVYTVAIYCRPHALAVRADLLRHAEALARLGRTVFRIRNRALCAALEQDSREGNLGCVTCGAQDPAIGARGRLMPSGAGVLGELVLREPGADA